jgi:hypothetical protein
LDIDTRVNKGRQVPPAGPYLCASRFPFDVAGGIEHAFFSVPVVEAIGDQQRKDECMAQQDLPEQAQNPVKDPEEWTTGSEPMTGPQASYLSTLMQQAGRAESDLDPNLTKAQASELIDELQKETGRGKDANGKQ